MKARRIGFQQQAAPAPPKEDALALPMSATTGTHEMTNDVDHLEIKPWDLKLTEIYTALMVGFIDEPEALDWLIRSPAMEPHANRAEVRTLLEAHHKQWRNNNLSSTDPIDKSFDPTRTTDGRPIKSVFTDLVALIRPDFDIHDDAVQAFAKELFEIRLLRYRFPTRHTASWSFYKMVAPICEIFGAPDWIAFWQTAIDSHPNIHTHGQSKNEIIDSYIYFENLPQSDRDEFTKRLKEIAQRHVQDGLAWSEAVQQARSLCEKRCCDPVALDLVLVKKLSYYCNRPDSRHETVFCTLDDPPFTLPPLPAEAAERMTQNYQLAGMPPPGFPPFELEKAVARVDEFLRALPRRTDPKEASDHLRETETRRLKHQVLAEHRRKREHAKRTDAVLSATHRFQGPLATARSIVEGYMERNELPEYSGLFEALLEIQLLISNILEDLSYEVQADVESDVRQETVRLPEALSALNFLKQDAALEGKSLAVAVPDAFVTVGWFELQSLTYEVIKNAIKHNTTGRAIAVEFNLGDDGLTLVVEDDGPGMTEEERDQIFELGYRGKSAEVAGTPGSGQGLYDVRRSVERLGGTIDIMNPQKGGMRVTIEVPCTWSRARDDLAS